MTTWFEYNERKEPMGDVLEFKQPEKERDIQHVDASTIVEKIELTAEMQTEFEKMGYTFEEDASA